MAMADGTDDRVAAAIIGYGDAVGLAFQMRDDVLDVFADAERTGKRGLSDLRSGKRTVLIARALALATPAQHSMLSRALGDRDLDEARSVDCRQIIAESGALASVETTIRAQLAIASELLAIVPGPARDALRALSAVAAEREH
jgi:geranylgeranyl diphosphate synthase type I